MNSQIVGGLLRRIYNQFNMENFDNRLKLQKIVFLLQQQGIDLGFNFNLYIYGPYSRDLTKVGFYIKDFEKIRKVKFVEEDIETKFTEFVTRIRPFKDKTDWLEIASTLCLFSEEPSCHSKGWVIKKVNRLKPKYNVERNRNVWGDLEGWLLN